MLRSIRPDENTPPFRENENASNLEGSVTYHQEKKQLLGDDSTRANRGPRAAILLYTIKRAKNMVIYEENQPSFCPFDIVQ